MSNHQHPDDHFHYGCFPRGPRRGTSTPTGGNNNNNNSRRGLFHLGQAPNPSFSSQFPQQDPTQTTDPSIAHFSQQDWQAHQVQGHQQAVTPFSSDPRYQSQQAAYGSYPSRSSPNMIGAPHDSRILPPPLNMPPSQMPPHISMAPATQVRSPTAGYAAYAPYPQQQAHTGFPYPHGATAPDPRSLPPPIPSMHPYDTTSSALGPRRNSLVERTSMRPGGHGSTPYPRVPSVATHAPEPPVEPVKKKRKRADAEQLKVLNETYNRTAFPSTEERIELAKKLGMSARSVQIWFQNKRQAMRQSSRQAAASAPPTTNQPYAAPSHSAPPPTTTPLPQTGGYPGHPGSALGVSSVSQAGYGTPRPSSDLGGMHSSSGRLNPSPSPSSHRRSHEEDPHRHDVRRFSPRAF
ncbi:homeobox-domain-containing protein [Lentinus tigrinus ALCF2SS1-7]|uniref:homeobox-domain-containing protein n=1 Tax=Lentinus tigrinus ALCF2SS1-7 TaxID=1328758 RepID=UPI001165D656|nr:homeobox-domain-containing protein [Lentinus tigrinus ALCF2SS1-7]